MHKDIRLSFLSKNTIFAKLLVKKAPGSKKKILNLFLINEMTFNFEFLALNRRIYGLNSQKNILRINPKIILHIPGGYKQLCKIDGPVTFCYMA